MAGLLLFRSPGKENSQMNDFGRVANKKGGKKGRKSGHKR
jgi:hypothetical protein